MVRARAAEEQKSPREIAFTRSDISGFLEWTRRQVKTHIKELEELEAVEVIRGSRGREYRYRLLRNSALGPGLNKLLTPEELREKFLKA